MESTSSERSYAMRNWWENQRRRSIGNLTTNLTKYRSIRGRLGPITANPRHDVPIKSNNSGQGMLDQSLRPVKEGFLHPFVATIPTWVSPNFLTYTGFLFGLAAPWYAANADVRLALGAWLVNRLLDGLDGTVARLRGQQTAWGGYMDIVCDFTVYSLLPLGVALSPSTPPADKVLLPLALLLGSFHVNNAILFYLASAIPQTTEKMTSLQMIPALVEGTESFCLFTLMLAFPSWFVEIAYGMAGLVGINILQRTWLARGAFEKAKKRA